MQTPRFLFTNVQSVGRALFDHRDDLSGVVSIAGPGSAWPPALIEWATNPAHDVLRLEFDDIDVDLLRNVGARRLDQMFVGHAKSRTFCAEDAQTLIDFGAQRTGKILVHCAGGWARSPACALILAAHASGPGHEDLAVASIMRYGGGGFSPNTLVVLVGDEVLGRQGALCRAWERKWNDGKRFDWRRSLPP